MNARTAILTGLAGGALWALTVMVVALARSGGHPRSAGAVAPLALLFPIHGLSPKDVGEGFGALRALGSRRHQAVDIAAPRGTPVVAATSGRVALLSNHPSAGLTVEQEDDSGRFCLVYAHLDGFAPGLREGSSVVRGQVLGYVGSTGNATAVAPHLHFAVHRNEEGACWSGTPLDPEPLFEP